MPAVDIKFDVGVQVYQNGRKVPKYRVDTDLGGNITLEDLFAYTKGTLIGIADAVLREELANGFDPGYVTVVDNQFNKPIIDVNPIGKIEFQARQEMKTICLETLQLIISKSPVDTGRYKNSHVVFLNGTQIATDIAGLTAWFASNPVLKDQDLFRFVNFQPYARKLERLGVTAGDGKFSSRSIRKDKSRDKRGRSGTHILAPNGVYFLTSRAIRRKYKKNSVIAFKFISGSEGFLNVPGQFKTHNPSGARNVGKGLNYSGRGTHKIKPPNQGRHYLYPSITISVDTSGIIQGGGE